MDEAADIVRRHGEMVWRTVYRLVGQDADAADCFQETFAAALEMGRRKDVRNWEAMLKRVATSKGLDLLRRRRRERKREAPDVAWEGLPGSERSPDYAAETGELGEQLRNVLAELAPVQAEAFCLRHISLMSYEEIAAELDVTPNAVGVMLHRARIQLLDAMNRKNVLRPREVNHGK
jgi:RNA polymerase sigma-70 factor (ECF subfamily)